jgi:HSP20 family protein
MAEREPTKKTGGNGKRDGQRGGMLTPARPWTGAFAPLSRLRTEFDRLFDDFFHTWPSSWGGERELAWDVDMQERDDAVVIRADAPGFEPSDFDVQIRGDHLVLCACQSEESAKEEEGFRWRKREFYRSIPLPAEIDADKIDANYRNGVLTLTLPKTEHTKGRKIEIKG